MQRLLIVLLTSYVVGCSYLIPIDIGLVEFVTEEIVNKREIVRRVDLNLNKQLYDSRKDIDVVVAITALNMDDRLNFYFTYYIMCPTELCQLLLILTLNTENVDTKYPYSLTLKYLIAHGLKTTTLNITDYQWHYYKRSLYTYDQNNTLDDNSKPFHNNQDADMMLLIPNGFNDLSLTGYMSSSFVLDTEMYVIHYMNMKTHDQPHMGWKVGTDYVLMRVVFLQKGYLQGCQVKELYKLQGELKYQCQGQKRNLFVAFRGTQRKEFSGKVDGGQRKIIFEVEDEFEEQGLYYGLIIIPYIGNFQSSDVTELMLLIITLLAVLVLGIRCCWGCQCQCWTRYQLYEEQPAQMQSQTIGLQEDKPVGTLQDKSIEMQQNQANSTQMDQSQVM